jgi:hypothetical protein
MITKAAAIAQNSQPEAGQHGAQGQRAVCRGSTAKSSRRVVVIG